MSAVLKDVPELQPMREDDLAEVMAIATEHHSLDVSNAANFIADSIYWPP